MEVCQSEWVRKRVSVKNHYQVRWTETVLLRPYRKSTPPVFKVTSVLQEVRRAILQRQNLGGSHRPVLPLALVRSDSGLPLSKSCLVADFASVHVFADVYCA